MHRQSGFSLVELMLATSLGLFLIVGLMQVYLSVEKTYRLQQAIIQLQDNGRFAIHFLSQHIRMAGYADCNGSDTFVNPDLAIRGYDRILPDFLKNKKPLKDTDSLAIGRCQTNQGVETFDQSAFFIGTTNRMDALGRSIHALYTTPFVGDKRELVSNIDAMQIRYGVLTADGKNTIYLAAHQISDWHKVISLEIALLLSSEFPVLSKPAPYFFAEKTFSADRFLHREWDTYITLRELQTQK